jgi:hypothetical protein
LAAGGLCAHFGPVLMSNWHFPPVDTFGLLVLWGWCGVRLLRDHSEPDPPPCAR